MKPRDGAVSSPGAVTSERPVTEEIGAAPAAQSRFAGQALKTAEIDVLRDRRATVVSDVPAAIAARMLAGDSDAGGRQSGPQDAGPMGDARVAARRQRAALRVDEARSALDAGELSQAVVAADAVLTEAEEAPPPGIVEVIEPARPLLTRVFATYVGPPGGVPVLAPRAQEIAAARLGDAERALLARVDGVRTLEELFDGSGLGSLAALRIAARLIRSGAIRII